LQSDLYFSSSTFGEQNSKTKKPIEAARETIDLARHIAHRLRIILNVSNDSAVSFHLPLERWLIHISAVRNFTGVKKNSAQWEVAVEKPAYDLTMLLSSTSIAAPMVGGHLALSVTLTFN
jgi:hypothetical protein